MRDWNHAARHHCAHQCRQVCSLPMRDWNLSTSVKWANIYPEFVAYLWGIETNLKIKTNKFVHLFVAYLWGIETSLPDLHSALWWLVCSLPMRDWNSRLRRCTRRRNRVCSLPMRDWNRPYLPHLLEGDEVCSLPMRDWNFSPPRI